MAALAPNTTARMWFDYQTPAVEHTMCVRFDGPLSGVGSPQRHVWSLLSLLEDRLLPGFQVLRVRASQAGSDISLPVDMDADLAAFRGQSGSNVPRYQEAQEVTWVGRSPTTGRRVRISLFGLALGTANDYRYSGEDWPEGAVDVPFLLNSITGSFLTVDGSKPQWYAYANVQYNSYWERRLRVG